MKPENKFNEKEFEMLTIMAGKGYEQIQDELDIVRNFLLESSRKIDRLIDSALYRPNDKTAIRAMVNAALIGGNNSLLDLGNAINEMGRNVTKETQFDYRQSHPVRA